MDYTSYFQQVQQAVRESHDPSFYRTTPEEAKVLAKKKNTAETGAAEYPASLPKAFLPIAVPAPFCDKARLHGQVRWMLLGQAAGDAVGLATEFMNKEMAHAFYTSRITYDHFLADRHRSRWMDADFRCGDWTDDTDQTLLILDSLVANNGKVNVRDFALRCRYWLHNGFTELGDLSGLGIGNNFATVVTAKKFLKDPQGEARRVWTEGGRMSAANGAVMRTSVAAVPFFWDEARVVKNALAFCTCTHADPRCQASVAIVVRLLTMLLRGRRDVEAMVGEAIAASKPLLDGDCETELRFFVDVRSLDTLRLDEMIGYTFKPVGCAIWALREAARRPDAAPAALFEELVTAVTMEAGDADTNCAVVGAVLGCYFGADCVPADWLALRHRDWLEDRIQRLCLLCGLI